MSKSLVLKMAAVGFAVVLAGCSSNDTIDQSNESIMEEEVSTGSADLSSPGLDDAIDTVDREAEAAALQAQQLQKEMEAKIQALLENNKIYFEFDRSALKSEAVELLSEHAQYLQDNPSLSVLVEGHADERGTREYNLALGLSRANTVADFLKLKGVNANRIKVTSYGEERPHCTGTGESCFQQNRRVELFYN